MSNFKNNLLVAMEEKQIKASELSRLTGISKARISQYTHGVYVPKSDALDNIANALGVSRERLLGRDVKDCTLPYKRFKLLGEISCGRPVFTGEESEQTVISSSDIDADFCLVAKGDSMINARIQSGDVVFLKECDMVNNGDIGAVIINDEATLKRIYYYPEEQKLVLVPENPNYEPLTYEGKDLDLVRIIGRAVAFRSNII